MAANGLKDDGIDVGDVLVIPATLEAVGKPDRSRGMAPRRPATGAMAKKALPSAASPKKQGSTSAATKEVRPVSKATKPSVLETAKPSPSVTENVALKPNVAPALAAESQLSATTSPERPQRTESPGAALLSGGSLQDNLQGPSERAQGVGIPTLNVPTVKPLSRAWAGVGVVGLILLAMIAHPRTRRLLLDRAAGVGKGRTVDLDARVDVLSSFSVGNGQRILSLCVDDQRLLVGVSQGRMDVLHRWSTSTGSEAPLAADQPPESLSAADAVIAAIAAKPKAQTIAPIAAGAEERARVATVTVGPNEGRQDQWIASPPVAGQARADVASAAANEAVTPSSDHLMSLWKNSVDTQDLDSELEEDTDSGWWMEGATGDELDRLADGPDSQQEPVDELLNQATAKRRRDQAASEVLATLRTRRLVDEGGDADPATQAAGAQGRSPGRRVARLGRRSRLSSGAAAAASGTTLSDVTTVVRRML